MARGIANNNPGNIDRDPNVNWQGMADNQSDPRFIVFKSPEFGIRALAKILLTYQNHDGLRTVRAIISRWAPPGENNTAAYIAAVSAGVGVGPDDEIDVDTLATMLPLIKAIIVHENGSNPYSDALLTAGLNDAGVSDAPPPALHQQPAFVAKAGAIGLGGLGACVDYCKGLIADPTKIHDLSNQAKDAAGQFDGFGGVFDHVKTALLTAGGGLLLASVALSLIKQRTA